MSAVRSSEVVTLVELVPYEWDNLSTGSQLEFVVTDAIPVPDAISGQLIVRVHENAISVEDGAGLSVFLDRISQPADEPETTFVDPTPMASVTLDSTDSAGTAKSSQLRWPLPALTRLRMVASQADASTEDNMVRVSAVLLLHTESCCSSCGGKHAPTRSCASCEEPS